MRETPKLNKPRIDTIVREFNQHTGADLKVTRPLQSSIIHVTGPQDYINRIAPVLRANKFLVLSKPGKLVLREGQAKQPIALTQRHLNQIRKIAKANIKRGIKIELGLRCDREMPGLDGYYNRYFDDLDPDLVDLLAWNCLKGLEVQPNGDNKVLLDFYVYDHPHDEGLLDNLMIELDNTDVTAAWLTTVREDNKIDIMAI